MEVRRKLQGPTQSLKTETLSESGRISMSSMSTLSIKPDGRQLISDVLRLHVILKIQSVSISKIPKRTKGGYSQEIPFS